MDTDSQGNPRGLYRYLASLGLAHDPLLEIIEHWDPPGSVRKLLT